MIVNKLDPKVTLGMAAERRKLSTLIRKREGGGRRLEYRSYPKSPSLRVSLFIVQSVTSLVWHTARALNKDQKKTSSLN